MHVSAVRIFTIAAAIFGAVTAFGRIESVPKDYVWTDSLGLSEATTCRESSMAMEKLPFRVVIPVNGANTQVMMVKDKPSLNITKDALAAVYSSSNIKIISPGKGPDSQRGVIGTVPSNTLARLTDQIIYTMKVPNRAGRLDRTFWMLEVEDGAVKTFNCPSKPNQPFYIFNVYLRDGSKSVIRVGISSTETQVFANAVIVRTVQEALDLDSNLVTQFLNIFGFSQDQRSTGGGGEEDEDEEGEDQSGSDSGNVGTPFVDGPITGPIGDLFHGNGQHSHIACKEKDGIFVRDESLEKVLFETGRFERVFVIQGFGGPARKKHVVKTSDGYSEEFTFIKVQLPDRPARTGEAVTGWVAEKGIALEAECKPFQDSLNNVVCMGEGSASVRGHDQKPLLSGNTPVRIDAGKQILLRDDWASAREKWTIDGTEYDFVPVIIPGQSYQDPWMALKFLKPEPVCKAEMEASPGSANGLNDPKCCNFPMNQPAGLPYEKKGDGAKGRYFGGIRRGGLRIHAGVDLFAPRGTKVYAVADGVAISPPRDFLKSGTVMTQVLDVKHRGGFIVRYGETDFKHGEFQTNSPIKSGQNIGKVSRTGMLHFELYDGSGSGDFYKAPTEYQRRHKIPTYERRGDLMNPFPYVHKWEVMKFGNKAAHH